MGAARPRRWLPKAPSRVEQPTRGNAKRLIAIECADQQARADGEDRYAGRHFAGILFRVRRGLVAAAFEEVASGVEVLLDVDVLHRGLQVVDHVVADSETAEELRDAGIACSVSV